MFSAPAGGYYNITIIFRRLRRDTVVTVTSNFYDKWSGLEYYMYSPLPPLRSWEKAFRSEIVPQLLIVQNSKISSRILYTESLCIAMG